MPLKSDSATLQSFIRAWVFGSLVAFFAALALACIFSLWNWLENPSGIFHDENGTRWAFIRDTAESWFLPSFFTFFFPATIGHWLWQRLSGLRRRNAT